ncbi:rab11 family-interacting protein 4A isoform X3 [Rhipicephalus sanguineus]|uniref:rab11 family-interacting protein 4A isoform X3 n=1 Tax=Rhipicephalus sanguineus TaxID=34632 RepID=UPI001895E0F8|nr:rab11 family-interacting protein 4A isoform X3 [Rhipicephalus sanguineus]
MRVVMADEAILDQLRQVFDLCDEERCGYITSDKLRQLGREHFAGSEQALVQLVQCLDPGQRGLISFKDFAAGVMALLGASNGHAVEVDGISRKNGFYCSDTPPGGGGGVDEAYMSSSQRPDSPTDSALPPSDRCSPVNHKGGGSSGSPSYSDAEETFECDVEEEDYGVMDVGKTPLSSDSFRSTSSSGGSTGGGGSGRRHLPQRNSWLRTSLRRSGPSGLLVPEGPRRGSFEAEDLLPLGVSSSNHHHHNQEEEERRQQCVDELGDQVHQLQSQVAALSESLASNGDLYRRVKQENATLVHRIHNLEEQIRELEVRSEERVHEEERRLKDALSRQERESALELERCGTQLRALQQEQRALQEEALRLRALTDRLKGEKEQALEQLDQSQAQLAQLREEHQRLQELCRREREEAQAQRSLQAQLLQEVGRELEELRRLRTDRDGRPRSPSLLDMLPARCVELQSQLEAVREENRALREANEELQAQLLSSHVHEGQCLVAGGGGHRAADGAASLATEFSNLEELSKDKLIDTVKHEKEDNVRLRAYIDGILLNIIENHPQLLEVKPIV